MRALAIKLPPDKDSLNTCWGYRHAVHALVEFDSQHGNDFFFSFVFVQLAFGRTVATLVAELSLWAL